MKNLSIFMNTVYREQLLSRLNWRYATKQFDPQRKIDQADWLTLEEALVLTPSSFGLQPWKFIVVTDQAMKEALVAASWGQQQVADCSHLVVLATKDLSEKDVDEYIDRIAVVRGVSRMSLEDLRGMIVTRIFIQLDAKRRKDWATRQVYIALGNLLNSAALLGIDACPMEGIDPDQYDRILDLQDRGLNTVVACAVGYRATTDKYASLKKVRFPKEQVFVEV